MSPDRAKELVEHIQTYLDVLERQGVPVAERMFLLRETLREVGATFLDHH